MNPKNMTSRDIVLVFIAVIANHHKLNTNLLPYRSINQKTSTISRAAFLSGDSGGQCGSLPFPDSRGCSFLGSWALLPSPKPAMSHFSDPSSGVTSLSLSIAGKIWLHSSM